MSWSSFGDERPLDWARVNRDFAIHGTQIFHILDFRNEESEEDLETVKSHSMTSQRAPFHHGRVSRLVITSI
jgi:hypothetical protein